MSIEVMFAIPSSSPSAVLVNDQERRVHREMDQLLSDIRRINPQGASYCTFGELFVDPGVEQYYEALVGTMKAAKRNGLIAFKGQFLLKGVNDEVIVRIVDSDDDVLDPENNEHTDTIRSCDFTTKAPSGTNKYDRYRHNAQQKKSSNSTGVEINLKKDIFNGNVNAPGASLVTEPDRTPYRPKLKARIELKRAKSLHLEGVEINLKKDILNGNVNAPGASLVTEPDRTPYRPKLKPRIELKRAKSMHLVGESRRPRSEWNTHMTRPTSANSIYSKQTHETHFERVDREVSQLLIDILRISPEGSPFCNFGTLFEDPQVEQYYEALVGTLRSAKRKGLIRFKGQMLLKGMNDNVQIDIVE